jgi:hypothetical protein
MSRILASGLTTVAMTAALALPVTVAAAPANAQTCSQSHRALTDASCRPGAYDPDVTQSTIGSTLCVNCWGFIVRPPTS